MKKILLLSLLFIGLISCSSSDDGNKANQITPPSWIQGTWLLEGSPVSSGYKFSSNDFCLIALTSATCHKDTLELYEGSEITTNVTQEISDSNYSIEVTIGSSIQTYNFEKVSKY